MRVEISGWPEEVKRPYTDKVHTFGLPNLKAIWAAKDNIKFKGKNVQVMQHNWDWCEKMDHGCDYSVMI